MAIYTNHRKYGGNFSSQLDEKTLSACTNLQIAVGYTGSETVARITPQVEKLVKRGGKFRLLVGTSFFQGLTQAQFDALSGLHQLISIPRTENGVRLSVGRLFHGKMYLIGNNSASRFFAGSANLSFSGLEGNLEFMSEIRGEEAVSAEAYLNFLMSPEQSAPLDRVQVIIRESEAFRRMARPPLEKLPRHSRKINKQGLPYIEIPFGDVDKKQQSGLNVYYGKGREASSGKIIPRPWFEVEVIVPSSITARPDYPRGVFTVFTDDGLKFKCKTGGDYYKNFRSEGDLKILGQWIKGKLQRSGALMPLSPVTSDTLKRYGKDSLHLYRLSNNQYYLEF